MRTASKYSARGEIAKLLADAGFIVLVSFISPFRSERRMARDLVQKVSSWKCSLTRRSRSVRRAIQKGSIARHGRTDKQFHRHRFRLRAPEQPELSLKTSDISADALADIVLAELRRRHVV